MLVSGPMSKRKLPNSPGASRTAFGTTQSGRRGERDVEKVRQKASEAGLKYAIAMDNDSRNGNAWANRV
jgi:hypothetical protein